MTSASPSTGASTPRRIDPGIPAQRARRIAFLILVSGTTALGAWTMFRIVAANGLSPLEVAILLLFTVTFAWITVPFWTAMAGFALRLLRRDPLDLGPSGRDRADGEKRPLRSRTAVVMPVFNEDPDAVTARLSAVARSLLATGCAGAFHIHLLSDTTDAGKARREEAAWARLQGEHPEMVFAYRRREDNRGRKAGNVGEFCRRSVDDYDFMVVLDADSVMSGATLVRLVRRMEADPSLGLIQTVPLPVRQQTFFGRFIQFASCLYGPLLAAGQAFWQGDAGNYWGHNAIVRLRPFAEHAALPTLPGRPPLGGEILSHDFVEAAWLRRAGWRVILDAGADGSWEEVPESLPDFARRDRRWAQGSLQHLRLLASPGLHPFSRLHLFLGAMGYLSSALWMLFLLAGSAWVLVPGAGAGAMEVPAPPPPTRISLLAATAIVLFLPKGLGLGLALLRRRRDFGGAVALVTGVVVETLFSVLLAPLMMLAHTRFVAEILLGRAVGWDPGGRRGTALAWSRSLSVAVPATAVGLAWGGITLALSPTFFLWMSPIFLGLLLSAPLVHWTAHPGMGRAARRLGLFVTPVEHDPPAELRALDHRPPTPVPVDPPLVTGVLATMLNAERALFDLQRGRPILVTGGSGDGAAGRATLVVAVEGLTDEALRAGYRLSGAEPRLVVTPHRARSMGLTPPLPPARGFSVRLESATTVEGILRLAAEPAVALPASNGTPALRPSEAGESAGLVLAHVGRMLPTVLAFPVHRLADHALREALDLGRILQVEADEALAFAEAARVEVRRISEAPVPLAQSEDTRFVLFRESYGLGEHVAILVGSPESWPDPVPVRLHSACLTGDLFGSLRCDCGEQLRGSLEVFASRGGGVLLYLAQEGRGIGLGNKFRAYSLQETGLDTIDADSTLGFGADERRYDIAARMLREIGVDRIELLTNNPEKVQALEHAGIDVVLRSPLHGRLNRHNLPYVRAKVQRAGHWLGDMLAQPLQGD